MPTRCATCSAPTRREIERQMRADVPDTTLASWTRDNPPYISRLALGKHRREHLGVDTAPGRKPVSGDFLELVRDDAYTGLVEGRYQGGVTHGLKAQELLDKRQQMGASAEVLAQIAMALTGQIAPDYTLRVLTPEEAEFEAQSAETEAELQRLIGPGTPLTDAELFERDRRESLARMERRAN